VLITLVMRCNRAVRDAAGSEGYLGGTKAARLDAPLPLLQEQSQFVESMVIKRRLPQVADWQIGESMKQGEVDG